MKRQLIAIASMSLILALQSACKKADLVAETPSRGSAKPGTPKLKRDSLETMYAMQSNPELILADRIISKNIGFVLDISSQEASELLIPNDLYQKYLEKVKQLNENVTKKVK